MIENGIKIELTVMFGNASFYELAYYKKHSLNNQTNSPQFVKPNEVAYCGEMACTENMQIAKRKSASYNKALR